MLDLPNRGILEQIFSSVGATRTQREHLCEIALMVALSDSFMQDDELERVIDLMTTYEEMRGIDRAWIANRAEELREESPLFSEARAQLVRDMENPKAHRLGLSLASKIATTHRPLNDDEKVLLANLADAFRIPPNERSSLFAPWIPATAFIPDTLGYDRCIFNAPERVVKQSIFDAMKSTESDQEFRMLTHKVSGVRGLITKLFDTAEVLALGEVVRVGPYGFRIDALIEHSSPDETTPGYQRWIARCLAPGEALHPLEHAVLATLSLRLDESAHILIVHNDDLSSTDKVFLSSFPANLLRPERLEA